jgi:hypothetical protein
VVHKFGKIIAILLATGGVSLLVPVAVYADSTSVPSQTVTTDQHSETVVTSSSDTHVVTDGGTTSDSGTTGATPADQTTIKISKSTESSSTATGSTDGNVLASSDNTIAATPGNDQDSSTKADLAVSGGVSSSQAATSETADHVRIAEALQVGNTKARSSIASSQANASPADAPTSQPASSRQLPPVQGALQGLSGALATFVVPQLAKLTGMAAAAHNLRTTSTTAVSTVLVIILTVLVGSFWLDYLRRSGYHGAARGDDPAGALLPFATPGKVDVIWATKPSYAPTFLVSETKAVTQRF